MNYKQNEMKNQPQIIRFAHENASLSSQINY